MKDFHRENPLFSLCGLNCGLCQMYVGGYCPGCGGEGKGSCAISRCSGEHGDVPYCYLCAEYPCERYAGFDDYDSILPCRNRQKDIARAKRMGAEAYTVELHEKMDILARLLQDYNDGRRKSFYMTAVYLLEIADVRDIMEQLPDTNEQLAERAAKAVALFKSVAAERGVDLKLHRKPKKQ